MSARVCRGCDTELPTRPGGGRQREWCGEACRKRTLYTGTCIDCSAPTSYSGKGTLPSERCLACRTRLDRGNRRWTPETIVAAIQRWAAEHDGLPPTAVHWNTTLARQTGRDVRGENYPCTNTVLHEMGSWAAGIEAAGFPRPRVGYYPRRESAPAVLAEVVDLYQSGLTGPEIADRLGVAVPTVYSRLERAGVARRPRFFRPREMAA